MEKIKAKSPTPVRIPDDILFALKKQAKKDNRTLSNLIITILRKHTK